MHRICKSLSTAGFDVLLVGRQRKDSMPLDEQLYQTRRISCLVNSGFFFYAEYNIRLFFYLLFEKHAVINSVDLDTLPAGRMASYFKRSKLAFDAHEFFTEVPELTGRAFTKKIWSLIEWVFTKGQMTCYTVNEEVERELERRTGKEFAVIYNYPIVKANRTITQIQSPIKLLYQGVLNKGRGLLELIEAVGSNDKYELHLIGKGDIETKIKELSKEHKNLILHGFVPPSKLHDLTIQFDIGMNLLDGASGNNIRSSANKFFDYIMAGLPVISMNFPEYKTVNDLYDIGILVEDLTPEKIISAIDMISLNYEKLSHNCAKASIALNWSSQSRKLIGIYEKM